MVKHNRNLWIFFTAFILIYGTLLTFTATINLQMKPYGYSDFQISLFALILIVMGVLGSIAWSLYLKKTTNYQFPIRAVPTMSIILMIVISIFLATKAPLPVIFITGGALGFSFTPILPISYDLGCELSFPIG
jgi:asparagine N-glycosylation enzyme membrane subunit Stt3